MAQTLVPLKKSPLEKPVAINAPTAGLQSSMDVGSMRETSAEDLAFRQNQEKQLGLNQQELVDRGMAGVEGAGQSALSGPSLQLGGPGIMGQALSQRAKRQADQTVNNILQKQRLSAPGQQFQNTFEVLKNNLTDVENQRNRAAFRQLTDINNNNLTDEERKLAFDEHMQQTQQKMAEMHRQLSDYVYKENKRRAQVAAKNQIIGSILQTGGTVAGTLIGGPAGGAVGGAAGGMVSPQSSPPVAMQTTEMNQSPNTYSGNAGMTSYS